MTIHLLNRRFESTRIGDPETAVRVTREVGHDYTPASNGVLVPQP